jgi:hypothetical protein
MELPSHVKMVLFMVEGGRIQMAVVPTVNHGEWMGCTWFRRARAAQMTCTLRLPLL